MENHSGLNYDLFGNVLPEPKPKPVPPQKSQEELDKEEDKFFMTPLKANAPKFTPVKEGQQHPMGKHGQYKLFHEHQWPKGYSPKRRDEVLDNAPIIVSTKVMNGDWGDTAEDAADTFNNDQRIRSEMLGHIARSTIPVEHLKNLSDADISIDYGLNAQNKDNGIAMSRGHFAVDHPFGSSHLDGTVRIAAEDEFPIGARMMRNIFGTRQKEEASTLMHELGHAQHFSEAPIRFTYGMPNPPEGYGQTNRTANPEKEGYAEGYRKAHNRLTRAMRRGRPAGNTGYETHKWNSEESKETYRRARRQTFQDNI